MKRLFKRDFTMVAIGQVISLFGNAILRFALPLYLLRETDSSSLFGIVTACSFIPMIIFSLLGGVIADRKNKRNIMVILDFATAGVIFLFYLALGKIPVVPLMVLTLMILYGISGTYQPAVQASVPLLTERETLMKGNAVINTVSTLSGLLGPVVGGVLFGSFGLLPILFISIGCFVLSAVMEIFIHIPYEKMAEEKGIFRTAASDVRECFLFIKKEKPDLFSVLVVIAFFNFIFSAAMVVGIPTAVVRFLNMSDAALGFTEAAMGAGGLAGGIIAGSADRKLKLENGWIVLAVCSLTAMIMAAALFDTVPETVGYFIITAAGFAAMCASSMFSVFVLTAVQRQTPPHMLGKIMAVIISVSTCSQPLGQAFYGVMFDILSDMPYVVMIISSAASVAVALGSKRVFNGDLHKKCK